MPARAAGFKPAVSDQFHHPGAVFIWTLSGPSYTRRTRNFPARRRFHEQRARKGPWEPTRGSLCSQTPWRLRTPGPDAAAAPAGRRAPGRAHAQGQPGGLRGAGRALPGAAARVLPPHAGVARGRRGRPAGGLRRRVQRDARRRPADQRAAVAVPDRAQPLPEPPAQADGDRRGLDGRPPRRERHERPRTRSTTARSSASSSPTSRRWPRRSAPRCCCARSTRSPTSRSPRRWRPRSRR